MPVAQQSPGPARAPAVPVWPAASIGGRWSIPTVPAPAAPASQIAESLWLATSNAKAGSNSVRLVGRSFSLDGWEIGQALTPDGTRAVIVTDATNSGTENGFRTETAVVDLIAGRQVGTTLSLGAIPVGPPVLTADGSRAVITGRPLYDGAAVMVVDTATGGQVGTTFTLKGQTAAPTVLNADTTRAFVITHSDDSVTGGTRVAVIDTATGSQVGGTITLPGDYGLVSGADEHHAVFSTLDGDWTTGFTTRVSVIDSATGGQIGSSVAIDGRPNGAALTVGASAGQQSPAGGNHVLITTNDFGPADEPITRLAVIDTETGAQIGAVTLNGSAEWTPLVVSADGSRAILTAIKPGGRQSEVAVVDTATGQQIGTTLTFSDDAHTVTVGPSGGTALITMGDELAFVDTATGVGSTISLPGAGLQKPLVSADGNQALITPGNGGAVIVNMTTGAHAALPFALEGRTDDFDVLGTGGTRGVIVTAGSGATGVGGTLRVTVVDTSTGARIGSPAALAGASGAVFARSADGRYALVVAADSKQLSLRSVLYTTRVALIDTVTGNQVGNTVTLPGRPSMVLQGAGDRALLTRNNGMNTQLTSFDSATGRKGSSISVAGEWGGFPLVAAGGTRVLIPTYRRGPVGTTTIQVAALS